MNEKLRPCPVCGREVSYEADFCPHCGKPFRQRHSVFYYVCAVIGSLLLIGLIAGIAFFILIAVPRAQQQERSRQRWLCENSLKQIGLAFRTWGIDHDDNYPFNLPTSAGGSLEYCSRDTNGIDANSLLHFLVISNELISPSILACPYLSTLQWTNLAQTNISYHLHTARQGDAVLHTSTSERIVVFCPKHHLMLSCDGSVSYCWSEAKAENEALAEEAKATAQKEQPRAQAAEKQAERQQAREQEKARDEAESIHVEAESIKLGIPHTWTFKAGNKLEARFEAVQGTDVLVKVDDGYNEDFSRKWKFYRIPVTSLADFDRKIVGQLARP